MKLNEAISKRIRQLLYENTLTKYQLFLKSGVAPSTLSKIINLKCKTVKADTLFAIAQGFGLTLAQFFDSGFFEEISD